MKTKSNSMTTLTTILHGSHQNYNHLFCTYHKILSICPFDIFILWKRCNFIKNKLIVYCSILSMYFHVLFLVWTTKWRMERIKCDKNGMFRKRTATTMLNFVCINTKIALLKSNCCFYHRKICSLSFASFIIYVAAIHIICESLSVIALFTLAKGDKIVLLEIFLCFLDIRDRLATDANAAASAFVIFFWVW